MIRVRPAHPEDVPRLMEISSSSATTAGWSQRDYAKLLDADESSRSLNLVVQENDLVVGFLVGRQIAQVGNKSEWEIENLALIAPARRRGLGSRLLSEFLDLVRSRGGHEVYLEVRPSNHAARTLYEKMGFGEAGVRKSYYQCPEEDALILKLSFPQNGS